jgi:hypothetical protein
MTHLLTKTNAHSLAIHNICRNLSVLVMLWLLDYHDGAVCVMGAVVADAPENGPE